MAIMIKELPKGMQIIFPYERDQIWQEISDNFKEVAEFYKDGKFDYEIIEMWFQQQWIKYKIERTKRTESV